MKFIKRIFGGSKTGLEQSDDGELGEFSIEIPSREVLDELRIFWDAEAESLNLLMQKILIWGLRDRDIVRFRGFQEYDR